MKLLIAILGLAAAAAAAPTLSIDDIAGVYKERFQNGNVDGSTYQSEDVLEIVKRSPDEAYIRTRLAFYNGHSCAIYGIARREGDALVYRPHDGAPCALTLRRKGAQILFGDANGACKEHFCGMRGSFDGSGFKLSARRSIRYMTLLLASREYADAVAERDGKR